MLTSPRRIAALLPLLLTLVLVGCDPFYYTLALTAPTDTNAVSHRTLVLDHCIGSA